MSCFDNFARDVQGVVRKPYFDNTEEAGYKKFFIGNNADKRHDGNETATISF